MNDNLQNPQPVSKPRSGELEELNEGAVCLISERIRMLKTLGNNAKSGSGMIKLFSG
jgi:hypothetical protein